MFGDKRQVLGSIFGSGPDGKLAEKKADENDDAHLHTIADELITAIHSRDVKGVVEAFHSLWANFEATEPYGEE